MTALQTEGKTPACGAKTNAEAFHGAYTPQIVHQHA
jgi:hypothetical protein